MILLHDNLSSDLSHVQAMGVMEDGFALFDYIRIEQNGKLWLGQIVQANRNVSTVGNPLDPTILHGLKLMQSNDDVQSVESVQVSEAKIDTGRQRKTNCGRFVVILKCKDQGRLHPLPTIWWIRSASRRRRTKTIHWRG